MTRPLRTPRFADERQARAWDDSGRAVRELQTRPRRFPVVLPLAGGSDPHPEIEIFTAHVGVRLVSAHWTQSIGTAAGADYLAFVLRAVDQTGARRPIGSFVTSSEPLEPLKPRAFEPLQRPTIPEGSRLTLEILETGTAPAWGPGTLHLLFEETG